MTAPDNPQYRDRVARLEKWQNLNIDPYGQRTDGLIPISDARKLHKGVDVTPHDGGEPAKVAGRIVLFKDMGKLIFITFQDSSARIQIGLAKQSFPETWNQAKLLELGDIAWFEGKVGHTKTGEVTIWASGFGLLTKALLPPPDKFHGLRDTELRYRQRYVDLFANPDSMDVFLFRCRMIDSIRDFLRGRRYIEVETPMMQAIAGGAAARPFVTHHNALNIDLFMRISPELYLKRLLVGGMERVFEINRNFRNEGIDTTHNPEFTMMEVYQAYSDLAGMMELTESLFVRLAKERLESINKDAQKLHIQFGERILDFSPPFERIAYAALFKEHVGVDMNDRDAVSRVARERGLAVDNKEHDVIVGELFEQLAEPALEKFDRPVFLYDYPAALCPLTRRKPGNSRIAERFELYIAGMELANAYTELNDPFVQEETFSRQLAGQKEEDSMAKMDHDFINALRYGMPPAGGLGIGIDRLCMVLTNRESIRDVVLFPLLKPQAGEAGGTGDGSPAMLSPRPPSPGDVDVTQMERDLARVESELRKAATKGKIPVMFSQDKDGSLHVLNM
jgi:lysyl-tRNA synthetase class 2